MSVLIFYLEVLEMRCLGNNTLVSFSGLEFFKKGGRWCAFLICISLVLSWLLKAFFNGLTNKITAGIVLEFGHKPNKKTPTSTKLQL